MQDWKRLFSTFAACALLVAGASLLGAQTPARIVSVAPAFTETLYALGLGSRVVGTTTYCDYPPEANQTERIGDSMSPNVEKILSLRPDVVFCGSYKWDLPAKLRRAGIRVVEVPDATSLADILRNITSIGKETGTGERAGILVRSMQASIQEVHKRFSAVSDHLPVAYMELDAGNWTTGRNSYINEALQTAGLKNIFADRKEPYMLVTVESVIARRPELILSSARTSSEIRGNPAWRTLPAVRNGRIIGKETMDWNALVRPGPRIAEGIKRLAELAHPAPGARRRGGEAGKDDE